MNFGSNAIKYGKPGGHVTFRTTTAPGDACASPSSTTASASRPTSATSIFEPFQRAGQETGPIEGTGIGLAISKRLAELMHGTVGFTSELGRGSEFWVECSPIAAATADAAAAPSATVAASRTARGRGSRATCSSTSRTTRRTSRSCAT